MCATYRLQLHAGFTLSDAEVLIPYLEDLGVSHLYLSPIFVARSGSTHGYDVVDPTRVNPELGGLAALDALTDRLEARGMGLILDLVPNHMAADHGNPWWMDVLTHGLASAYADFFDIDWHSPRVPVGRLLLPLLAAPLDEVLGAGELVPFMERPPVGEPPVAAEPRATAESRATAGPPAAAELAFYVRYHDRLLPLEPGTWPAVLRASGEPLPSGLRELAGALGEIPGFLAGDEGAAAQRRRSAAEARRTLALTVATDPAAAESVRRALAALTVSSGGSSRGAPALAEILDGQPWLLAHHREAGLRLNYRRFFDISDLVGVRVEDERVFAVTHALVLDMAERGRLAGVRVDHIDGLRDPTGYLVRLRDQLAERHGRPLPILVEKILSPGETLPREWPVAGSTGYEFLNALNHVFVDAAGLTRLGRFYAEFTGRREPFAQLRHRSKRMVLQDLLGGEMQTLNDGLAKLAERDQAARTLAPAALAEALLEVTAALSVYRTYIRGPAVGERDRALIDQAVDDAQRRNPGSSAAAFAYLRRLLTLRALPGAPSRDDVLEFVLDWQQVSGPAMAKGVEDTAFYRYNRLIALDEVGGEVYGDPQAVTGLHSHNQTILELWPGNLSATSTHDTKRSEDVRARIDVLAEIPEEFASAVTRWRDLNPGSHPDPNEEYLIYQALLGAWPLDRGALPALPERMTDFVIKALREAKDNTSWLEPDLDYEGSLREWMRAVLQPRPDNAFLEDFRHLQERVAWYGMLVSLAQIVVKTASPGVPDFYQGSYLWDLSLVDPDNRRPVDFATRMQRLDELEGAADVPAADRARELLGNWTDGRIKLSITRRTLLARRRATALFAQGDYLPLEVSGRHAHRVFAFARRRGSRWAVAVVPRLPVGLAPQGVPPLGCAVWADTRVLLPPDAPREWTEVCSGSAVTTAGLLEARETAVPVEAGGQRAPDAVLNVADVLRHLPVALLRHDPR